MAETKKRKASIREEDMLLLLNKYSPTAILNLLKEVAQFAGVKIDWNTLVKRTNTGISSAREYQMLWRHLAYRVPLLEKLEAGAEPLDDDSDLEFELETFPAVNGETSAEAAASVKILFSSGMPIETGASRPTVEVPLPANTANGQMPFTASDKQLARSNRGANTAVPCSLQKQPQAGVPPAEVLDGSGSANATGPSKKKRKLWTKEEDMELIAAVDKCGEGNWANILKGDFKHDRTASQLSQRWSIIRKRRANISAGSGCNPTASAPTEAHTATWQAVNMALKMPIIGGLSARRPGSTGALQLTDAANSSVPSAAASEATTLPAPEVPNQSHQANNQTTSQKGALNPPSKSRANSKIATVPVKPLGGPTSIIQAAAFAAGGRIATPSTAASHFKAAQSKIAVHVRPGSTLSSSTISGSKSSTSTTVLGPQQPSNIRCIKTSNSSKDPATIPGGSRTTGHQGICSSSDQLSPGDATPSNQPTEQVQVQSLSASPVRADAHGNGDSRITGALLGTTDSLSKEKEKSAEDTKLDSPVPCAQVHLLNLDVILAEAGGDQNGDKKAAADRRVAGEPEITLSKSDSPCVDMTEKALAAVEAGDDDAMEMTSEVPRGEMAENQIPVDTSTEQGNVENQMHNSDVEIVAENKTSEETASQNLMPDDDRTIRD